MNATLRSELALVIGVAVSKTMSPDWKLYDNVTAFPPTGVTTYARGTRLCARPMPGARQREARTTPRQILKIVGGATGQECFDMMPGRGTSRKKIARVLEKPFLLFQVAEGSDVGDRKRHPVLGV